MSDPVASIFDGGGGDTSSSNSTTTTTTVNSSPVTNTTVDITNTIDVKPLAAAISQLTALGIKTEGDVKAQIDQNQSDFQTKFAATQKDLVTGLNNSLVSLSTHLDQQNKAGMAIAIGSTLLLLMYPKGFK